MLTMETSVEDQPIVSIDMNGVQMSDTNILADLCEEAGRTSIEIRNCLKTYSLNTPTKQLECLFKHFKKPLIVQTLKFLNATDHNWDDYKKDACVHELICRIQNLLIDKCQFCEQHYATPKDEGSLLNCSLCGQSVHKECLKKLLGEKYSETITAQEVMNLINPFNISSLNFMCLECTSATLPQSSDSLKNSVAKKSTAPDGKAVTTIDISQNKSTSNTTDTQPKAKDGIPEVSSVDCEQYLIGQCPHGISGKTEINGERCKFTHRKCCRKFCHFGTRSGLGCKKGKNCQYFHPILCKYSVQRGLCTNLECKFTHLKRTKRFGTIMKSNYYTHHNQNTDTSVQRGRNHQHSYESYANYNEQNHNMYFPCSARADVQPGSRSQGFRDPATQATSANTGRHMYDKNPNFNNTVFSFLEQQVQLLKEDLNSQIGDLKSCFLKTTHPTASQELSRNLENCTQDQCHPNHQSLPVQHTDQNAITPHLNIQSHQQHSQQLQRIPYMQSQWNPSQLIPFQSSPTQAY